MELSTRVQRMIRWMDVALGLCVLLLAACVTWAQGADPHAPAKSLFDGKTLQGWKTTAFGGEGEVEVKDGKIILAAGNPMTGITYAGEVPKREYEISLEAMRVEGSDFFCALTFPVGDDPCTFVVGGWGGGVVGLSNLDGFDASENETTRYQEFSSNRWYAIRVRVTRDKIEAWIDKTQMVDVDIKDRKISIRPEVELSRPLGISSYSTTAALRSIQVRPLAAKPADK
jgi:hypothetical protein